MAKALSLVDMLGDGGPEDDDIAGSGNNNNNNGGHVGDGAGDGLARPTLSVKAAPASPLKSPPRQRSMSFAFFGRRAASRPVGAADAAAALSSMSASTVPSVSTTLRPAPAAALPASQLAPESAPSTPTAATSAGAGTAFRGSPASTDESTGYVSGLTRARSGFWSIGRRAGEPPSPLPGPPSEAAPAPGVSVTPPPLSAVSSAGGSAPPPALAPATGTGAGPPPAAAPTMASRRRSFGGTLSLSAIWSSNSSSAPTPVAAPAVGSPGSVAFPAGDDGGGDTLTARRGGNRYSSLFRDGPVPTTYGQRWSSATVAPVNRTTVRRSNTGGTLDRMASASSLGTSGPAGLDSGAVSASTSVADLNGGPLAADDDERDMSVIVEHGAERVELHFPSYALGCDVVRAACDHYAHWDDRQYTLFSLDQQRIVEDSERVRTLLANGKAVVRLLTLAQVPAILSPRQQNQRNSVGAKGPSSSSASLQMLKRSSMALAGYGISKLKKRLKPDTIYLSVLAFNSQDMHILMTTQGLLPTITVAHLQQEPLTRSSEQFQWAMRRSLDLEQLTSARVPSSPKSSTSTGANIAEIGIPANDPFRASFFGACEAMRTLLELSHLGVLFDEPIVSPASTMSHLVFVVDVASASPALIQGTAHVLRASALRWAQVSDISSLWYPPSHRLWMDFGAVYRHRTNGVAPGLYLGVLYVQNTFSGIDILVPKAAPAMIPLARLRDDATVTPDEWAWMRGEGTPSPFFSVAAAAGERTVKDVLRDERRLLISAQRANRQGARVLPIDDFRASLLAALELLMTMTKLEWTGNDLYRDEDSWSPVSRPCRAAGRPQALPIDADGRVRVLLFVRPLQPLAAEEAVVVDALHHVMLPFTLFEPMHQQVFNTRRASEHRRRTLELEQQIQQLQYQLETIDAGTAGQREVHSRLKEALARLADSNKDWRQRTWLVRVMEWERGRSWERMTIRRRPPAWMTAEPASPRSPSPGNGGLGSATSTASSPRRRDSPRGAPESPLGRSSASTETLGES